MPREKRSRQKEFSDDNFPAIDIKNGNCVRLYKGDMNTAEKVADDFLSAANSFYSCGAEWIHMVDLDGAVKGEKVNSDIFTTVAEKRGFVLSSAAAYAPWQMSNTICHAESHALS